MWNKTPTQGMSYLEDYIYDVMKCEQIELVMSLRLTVKYTNYVDYHVYIYMLTITIGSRKYD